MVRDFVKRKVNPSDDPDKEICAQHFGEKYSKVHVALKGLDAIIQKHPFQSLNIPKEAELSTKYPIVYFLKITDCTGSKHSIALSFSRSCASRKWPTAVDQRAAAFRVILSCCFQGDKARASYPNTHRTRLPDMQPPSYYCELKRSNGIG